MMIDCLMFVKTTFEKMDLHFQGSVFGDCLREFDGFVFGRTQTQSFSIDNLVFFPDQPALMFMGIAEEPSSFAFADFWFFRHWRSLSWRSHNCKSREAVRSRLRGPHPRYCHALHDVRWLIHKITRFRHRKVQKQRVILTMKFWPARNS